MASKFLKEFRDFAERGNAIDMAIGIIVGSVMTGVVNSLVKDVIMPPIGLLIGGVDFSQWFFVLAGANGQTFNTIAEAQAAGCAGSRHPADIGAKGILYYCCEVLHALLQLLYVLLAGALLRGKDRRSALRAAERSVYVAGHGKPGLL